MVHYTANPGATAMANRNYFEGLKDSHVTRSSSNFIVGLEGEIIQCVPTWEVAYASNDRNHDTVSIECCHPDESGKFTDATYRSAVQLCAWLCLKFDLGPEDVIRHYDVTGKDCPRYFVQHEDAWEAFRADVGKALERAGRSRRKAGEEEKHLAKFAEYCYNTQAAPGKPAAALFYEESKTGSGNRRRT